MNTSLLDRDNKKTFKILGILKNLKAGGEIHSAQLQWKRKYPMHCDNVIQHLSINEGDLSFWFNSYWWNLKYN